MHKKGALYAAGTGEPGRGHTPMPQGRVWISGPGQSNPLQERHFYSPAKNAGPGMI